MKLLAALIFVSVLPGQPPPDPEIKPTAPASASMTDKQRGDYWFARFKVAEAELAMARAKTEALERIIMAQPVAERDRTGQAVMQSCPTAKMNPAGDIECPKAEK